MFNRMCKNKSIGLDHLALNKILWFPMSGGLGRLKIKNAIWNFGILDKKKLQNDVHAKGRWGQSSTDDNPSYHYFMISNWADFLSLNNRKDKVKYGLGKVGKNRQAERP